jgi:hypothetical protein
MRSSDNPASTVARSAPPQVSIERTFSAKRLNEILNHPDVRPWVADPAEGAIDITSAVRNQNNVLLLGAFGGCLCFKLAPGLYEVHSQFLPEGRGPWALAFVKAGAHWMFTNTDALEIVTRVPYGHQAARTLTVAAGMQLEFTRPDGCMFEGKLTPVDIYTMSLQHWLQKASSLIERGRRVHEEMYAQAKELGVKDKPHADDPDHNRVVGAAFEMAMGGQLMKAIGAYNRWATLSRHAPISLISATPPTIKFDIGLMKIVNGKIEITPC